jgi:hypothetical protein
VQSLKPTHFTCSMPELEEGVGQLMDLGVDLVCYYVGNVRVVQDLNQFHIGEV